MSNVAALAGAAVLVVVAGGCAMADTALARVSPNRVFELEKERAWGARALSVVVRSLPAHVSLLLLLRLACELTATVLVAWVAIKAWGLGPLALSVTAAAMTVVSFVLVGVGPRTIGRQRPYPVALALAGLVRRIGHVFGPLSRLLIAVGNAVTPGRGYREGPFATEGELRDLLDLAEQRGDVEHDERDMIHSVFELGDTMVREVMVPRTDVVWIEQDKSVRQTLTLALRSGFSRIPVIGTSVDDVVGVAYLKDLVLKDLVQREGDAAVATVMREAEFIPEFKPIDDLLREMQARRIHMAIVVDEYGGTAGLVTIEDILEEIVGEIADEYDNELPPIQYLDDGSARITARMSVEDLEEHFDVELPNGEAETVGGLLAHVLGKVPIPGATVTVAGLTLVAESVGGRRNRVDTVRISRAGATHIETSPTKSQPIEPDARLTSRQIAS